MTQCRDRAPFLGTHVACCHAHPFQDTMLHAWFATLPSYMPNVLISAIPCLQNLRPVISQLLTMSNTTEQRDGRRDTPLMLARKRGLKDVVGQLLAAGATDLHRGTPEAESRTWSAGDQPMPKKHVPHRHPCASLNAISPA